VDARQGSAEGPPKVNVSRRTTSHVGSWDEPVDLRRTFNGLSVEVSWRMFAKVSPADAQWMDHGPQKSIQGTFGGWTAYERYPVP
jgi:hypothetical protein